LTKFEGDGKGESGVLSINGLLSSSALLEFATILRLMKPPKSRTDGKTWLSLTLSVLSFVVSGVALWNAALAPADMRVSLSSDLMFHWEGGASDAPGSGPGWHRAGLTVVANCTFANNGAKVGEIKGLSLQLQDDDGTRWVFEPWFIVDEEKLIDMWALPEDQRKGVPWATVAPAHFRSVVLPGKQTANYSYYFRDDPNFSKNLVLGPPHRFHVTLFSASPGESELRVQDREILRLDAMTVGGIQHVPSVSVAFEGVGEMVSKSLQK
jgi:hypothetical protein